MAVSREQENRLRLDDVKRVFDQLGSKSCLPLGCTVRDALYEMPVPGCFTERPDSGDIAQYTE